MQNQADFLVVQTSCPDKATALEIAHRIIAAKLAASVNILPEMTSVYEWKGELRQDSETLLLIKTTSSRYAELQAIICESHPYELPEVIAVPITEGLPDFLSWINDMVNDTTTKVV